MGREVRRVPADFAWPIGKTWEGFLLPERLHEVQCRDCDGEGYGPEARAIARTFYPHQIGGPDANALAWHDKLGQAEVDNLVAEGRLSVWEGGAWVKKPRAAAEVNADQGRGGFGGHDAINRMILVEFRCKALGIEPRCPACEGHGTVEKYPGQRTEAEAWQETDPPTGEAWQLWETTSEGSPISPPCDSPEALARWLADNGASSFGSATASYETWLDFIRGPGWAPSMVLDGSGLRSGVEMAAERRPGGGK